MRPTDGSEPDRPWTDDTPTPVTGIPAQPQAATDDMTPPTGIEGLAGAVTAEDFGQAGPAVFGAEPQEPRGEADADDWPKLEYRSRNKPERRRGGMFDTLRGRNDDQQ